MIWSIMSTETLSAWARAASGGSSGGSAGTALLGRCRLCALGAIQPTVMLLTTLTTP